MKKTLIVVAIIVIGIFYFYIQNKEISTEDKKIYTEPVSGVSKGPASQEQTSLAGDNQKITNTIASIDNKYKLYTLDKYTFEIPPSWSAAWTEGGSGNCNTTYITSDGAFTEYKVQIDITPKGCNIDNSMFDQKTEKNGYIITIFETDGFGTSSQKNTANEIYHHVVQSLSLR